MIPAYVNQLFRQLNADGPDRVLRILGFSADRTQFCLFDIQGNLALPFWIGADEFRAGLEGGSLVPVTEKAAGLPMRLDSQLSAVAIASRDKRLAYMAPLLQERGNPMLDSQLRNRAVTDHLERFGGTSKQVYKLSRLWWRHGQLPNALVPSYSESARSRPAPTCDGRKLGRPRAGTQVVGLGGVNATPEMKDRMQVAGRRFLKKGMSVRTAYRETLLEQFSDQVVEDGLRSNVVRPDSEIPSLAQFHYHVARKLERSEILKATGGETRFARKNRDRPGTLKNARAGPGDDYQIDATVGDIFLRSHDYPDRLIGRPVIYIVCDVWSRMIVGFCVALSGPSWEVAKLALENAMTEKVASCARHGVAIATEDWPCWHVPGRLTCDRGSDMTSASASAAAAGLRFELVNLPPYRPDWKGLVESRFQLLQQAEIKWAPGASHGRDRGEPKHQLDAVHTLGSFTKLMINYIINYNCSFQVKRPPSNYMSLDGRTPTPLELWNWGVRNLGAPQVRDPDIVRANLLHVGKARETDRHLAFGGLHYRSDILAASGAFQRSARRKWRTHEIRHDPRDVSTILLLHGHGSGFEACHLTEAHTEYKGWTADEVQDRRSMEHEGNRLGNPERLKSASEHQARMADLNRTMEAQAAAVPLTRASASGIRSQRKAENRQIRARDAWTSVTPDIDVPMQLDCTGHGLPGQPEQATSASPDTTATPVPNRMDVIRAARQAALRGRESGS